MHKLKAAQKVLTGLKRFQVVSLVKPSIMMNYATVLLHEIVVQELFASLPLCCKRL